MMDPPRYRSHGDGAICPEAFASLGENVVFEAATMVFHPENIFLGNNIYVGHQTILKGYFKHAMRIGSNVWIGQQCFFHAGGGITIEDNVGIGPGVKILTSAHVDVGRELPILFSPLRFAPVTIERDADIGMGALLLPGVRIGRGAQVGAGAVVTSDVDPYTVVVGVPAVFSRQRATTRTK